MAKIKAADKPVEDAQPRVKHFIGYCKFEGKARVADGNDRRCVRCRFPIEELPKDVKFDDALKDEIAAGHASPDEEYLPFQPAAE